MSTDDSFIKVEIPVWGLTLRPKSGKLGKYRSYIEAGHCVKRTGSSCCSHTKVKR